MAGSSDVGHARAPELGELASFKLRRLVNMYTKASAGVYKRKFDISMNEWRLLALLYSSAEGLSIMRLATQAQFDRGMTSRIVAGLIDRSFARRDDDLKDGRAVVVTLTDTGRELVSEVASIAFDRVEELLSCLTRKERDVFEKALDKITHQAYVMLDHEREMSESARDESSERR